MNRIVDTGRASNKEKNCYCCVLIKNMECKFIRQTSHFYVIFVYFPVFFLIFYYYYFVPLCSITHTLTPEPVLTDRKMTVQRLCCYITITSCSWKEFQFSDTTTQLFPNVLSMSFLFFQLLRRFRPIGRQGLSTNRTRYFENSC